MGRGIPWPQLTAAQHRRLAKIGYSYPLARVIGYDKNSDEMEPLLTLDGERHTEHAKYLDRRGVLV